MLKKLREVSQRVLLTLAEVGVWSILLFLAAIGLLLLAALMFSDWGLNNATTYKPVGEFIGAFATPVIALIAAYIAAQQNKTNRRQLQLARYERQKPVYTATYNFLHEIMISSDGTVHTEALNSFLLALRESHFIFDGNDVPEYLGKLRSRQLDLARFYRQLKSTRIKDKTKIMEDISEVDDWFQDQFADKAREVFKSHLKLR